MKLLLTLLITLSLIGCANTENGFKGMWGYQMANPPTEECAQPFWSDWDLMKRCHQLKADKINNV